MKAAASGVLYRMPPCDVPRGYASVVMLLAALLDALFDRPGCRGSESGRQHRSRRTAKDLRVYWAWGVRFVVC